MRVIWIDVADIFKWVVLPTLLGAPLVMFLLWAILMGTVL